MLTQAVESLEREIQLLQNMKHNRIVQYYGTERTETSVRIFMEYMPGVSSGVNTTSYVHVACLICRFYGQAIILGIKILDSIMV